MFKQLLVLFFSVYSISNAAIVFVSKGDDGDYTTIQNAVNKINPGDTVFVKEGVYSENVTLEKTTGDSDHYFTISTYKSDSVTVTGGIQIFGSYYKVVGFIITPGDIVFKDDAAYNIVEKCTLHKVTGSAVTFDTGTSYNTVRYCTIYRPGNKACLLKGYFNTVEYSIIEGPAGQDGESDADAIRVNKSDHCVIRGNRMFHFFKVGSSHSDLMQSWKGFIHLTIEDNILGSWDIDKGNGSHDPSNAHFMLELESTTYDVDTLIIRRNIFLGGAGRSLSVWRNQGSNDRRFRNVWIYNNLFYTHGYAELYYMVNLQVKNNIFYTPHDIDEKVGYHLKEVENENVDYNCFYPESKNETHAINKDPLFVNDDRYEWDFHLMQSSPCINEGVDVGLTRDFDGIQISDEPDIGPYEFTTSKTNGSHPRKQPYDQSTDKALLRESMRIINHNRQFGSLFTLDGKICNFKHMSIPHGIYIFSSVDRRTFLVPMILDN